MHVHNGTMDTLLNERVNSWCATLDAPLEICLTILRAILPQVYSAEVGNASSRPRR